MADGFLSPPRDNGVMGTPTRRRRKKKTPEDIEHWPMLDTYCGAMVDRRPCGWRQHKLPSGPCCKHGHGGAPGFTSEERSAAGSGDWVSGDPKRHDPPKMTGGQPTADEVAVKLQEAIDKETADAKAEGREFGERPAAPFEVREGDRLSVTYAGAKLQIVQFNTVELDGAFYSRTLKPGDDPAAEWDRIYAFLRDKALAGAREKLATFADELKRARARAKPGHPDGK